ncbi:VOC family protein [Fimbriimonas ginsengisoli]|uniref:Glyoxalase/bleomycin resistance protein/dioxygenase n=1 Tax=Fimbriimonas ginsengisoli Gsoil 348 TaxID=661478 RepID=A0A068NSG5_FIMGI|nr:VOC family protein [Fimbriimonas ginsengisoli]AIE85705.1 glyoxalase/bleomycin resistance protein/dioxygenase [Fimbriimonas ginsengisoli Gsoil 348]
MSLGNKKLAQVAIVVKDMELAVQRWAAVLGVDPPNIIVTDPGSEVNGTYRGKPTNDRAKLAFFDIGCVQLELIEPIGKDSAWYEGYDKRGESLHHIAFWTDDMRQSKTFLDEHGVTMIQRGDMGDGQYAYFDGQEQIGTMIELLEQKRTPLA